MLLSESDEVLARNRSFSSPQLTALRVKNLARVGATSSLRHAGRRAGNDDRPLWAIVRELAPSADHIDHVLAFVPADEPVSEPVRMGGEPEMIEGEPPHPGEPVARLRVHRGRVDALPVDAGRIRSIVVCAV